MLQPNKAYIDEQNKHLLGITITIDDKSVYISKTLYVYYTHGGSKLKRGIVRRFRSRGIVVIPDGAKLAVRTKGVKVDYSEITRISCLT